MGAPDLCVADATGGPACDRNVMALTRFLDSHLRRDYDSESASNQSENTGKLIALNVTALTCLRVRNASLSLLLGQKFLPIFRWAGSAQLPEHSRKVLLRFEAAGHGDIQDSHVGRPQHVLCALDSMVQDKLVRAFPG
jgi:hypothetical protein